MPAKKSVQWLYQELPELVSKGVLSETAADKLREHYGDIKTADKKWFVIVLCGVLGALFIGLGIILLVGHNWEQWSRPTRTVLSILPLILAQGLALWVLWKRPLSDALKESTATFLTLMVGASMALISQTYNITWDTTDFILSWMLLIVPLVYLMQASIPAAIYVGGIATWAVKSSSFWDPSGQGMLFWPLLGVVVPHFVWAVQQEKYAIRSSLLTMVMAISIAIEAGFTLGRAWPGGWIIMYSSLFTLFYLIGTWEFKKVTTAWQRELRVFGGLAIFVMMFMLTFRFPWQSVGQYGYYTHQNVPQGQNIADYILAVLMIGAALLMSYAYARRRGLMSATFVGLPVVTIFAYMFATVSVDYALFLCNVFLFTASVARILSGIKSYNLGVINTGMVMLAALILARFFDSEVSFMVKGLVFILVGLGFLFTNVMVLRRKRGKA